MKLTSKKFTPGGSMPAPYTCFGENINPPLNIEEVPSGAQSLVLIFEDVDATPAPWTHWLLFNIPADTLSIEEAAIPPGASEGLANNNTSGYEGPCAKYFSGKHHYRFVLYALGRRLSLSPQSDRRTVENDMADHILATAELFVTSATGDADQ